MSSPRESASREPIRLVRPLNAAAARAANDTYYGRHPELVHDGRRTPLNRHDPAVVREWSTDYLAHGGEALIDKHGRNLSEHKGHLVELLPRGRYTLKKEPTKTIRAPRAHVFYSSTAALEVEHGWPLRGYYVHVDLSPAASVNFGIAPPLWTDEHGILHETDGNGLPVRPLQRFAFAWSDDEARDAVSIAIVYDRDRTRLAARRRRVEALASAGPLPETYLFRPVLVRTMRGDGVMLQARVPDDPEIIDLRACHELIAECNEVRERVEAARNKLQKTLTGPMSDACYRSRAEIDAWFHERPRLRGHLRRVPAGANAGKTFWQVTCEKADSDLANAVADYEHAVEPLLALLKDTRKMELLGRIDRRDDDYNIEGDHQLWRHEFIVFALGAFASTRYEAEVFARFVEPLFECVSGLWGGFRDGCDCGTCLPMHEGAPDPARSQGAPSAGHATSVAPLDLSWLQVKDLKIGTRTAQRLVDLMTKYREQIGKALHESRDLARLARTFSFAFMLRTGGFNSNGPLYRLFERWSDAWKHYYEWATTAGDQRNARWSEIKKELEQFEVIPRGQGLERVGRDVFKGISTAASLIGVAATMYDVLNAKHLSAKNYADSVKSATEVVQGVIALNDAARNGGYEKYVAKLYMARQVDEASALALAKATQQRLTMLAKWSGVIGGVSQLFTAGVAIDEAADRGDTREYTWAWVQGVGAGVSMVGLWMDCSLAGAAIGVVLNIMGGGIYLVGGAGEFLTRPAAIEVLFRAEGLWTETPQWAPGELEEVERIEAQRAQRWVDENRHIHPFDGL